MLWTCSDIINKRKKLWKENNDIELDRDFIESIAATMVDEGEQGNILRREIAESPYLLIEMFFVIVDKDLRVVPFFLNDVQVDFQNKLTQAIKDFDNGTRDGISFLILKGRQQGFTSYITAYQLASTLIKKNFSGFTIADSSDNTSTIFEDKCKYIYDSLPEQIKPKEKYNTKTELILEELNSKWRCSTANSKGVGRSKTVNFFHGSEAAFWKSITKVVAGLGQALTKKSIRILESTANGFNEFRDLWAKAERGENNFTPLFYEWWNTSEYKLPIRDEDERADMLKILKEPYTDFHKKLQWLRDHKKLSLEQIKWYMFKEKELGDDLPQEYPCTADEAFLSSGQSVFDKQIVMTRIQALERLQEKVKPIRGYMTWKYNNDETRDFILKHTIEFVKDPKGHIWLYEYPKIGTPYVIGGDTAEGGLDYNAAHIIDNITGRQVAKVHKRMDVDVFAHELYCLGTFFSKGIDCLIGVETNFDLHCVKELQRLNYPKQYIRETMDSMGEVAKKFGFNTNKVSRNTLISNLRAIVRESCHLINDIDTLREMLSFEEIDGKAQASEGEHDDLVMSIGITYMIRTQQEATITVEPSVPVSYIPMALQDDNDDYTFEHGFYL